MRHTQAIGWYVLVLGTVLLIALLPVYLAAMVGQALAPLFGLTAAQGAWYAAGAAALLVGGWVVFQVNKTRHTRAFARQASAQITAQISALTWEEARDSVLKAIDSTAHITVHPALLGPPPGVPPDVRDFFQRFDRLELYQPDIKKPLLWLAREAVVPAPNNPDGLIIGGFRNKFAYLACHLPTGRVVMGMRSVKAGEIAAAAAKPGHSAQSVWHLLASWTGGIEAGRQFETAQSTAPTR